MKVPGEDHGVAVKERLRIHSGAPQDLLGEPGLPLVRIKLVADRRVDSIGPDQEIRPIGDLNSGAFVMEACGDVLLVLLETVEAEPTAKITTPDAFAHRPQQQRLQPATMNGVLRPSVPGGEPALFAPDRLTELVE